MKLKIVVALLLIFSGSLVINSCKHEPMVAPAGIAADDHGGNNGNGSNNGNGNGVYVIVSTCDPDTVYFQNTILPLFVSNCAMNSCHDATSHQEGIVLNSYSNIMNTGHVRAFDVNHGKVYKNITTSDPGDRMPPPPRPKMDTSQIRMITTWINQGALNNSCTSGCDTTNVTYAGTIAPLFQSQCNGCHNSASPGGSINLATYNGVHSAAISGRLFGSVSHSYGFSPMPKSSPILPECVVAEIRIWVDNGALNN